jgi:hypothetical protein
MPTSPLTTEEQGPHADMQDGASLYFPTAEERAALANQRYYGLGKDFDNFTGPEIEYFRDKMQKRFEEFKQ